MEVANYDFLNQIKKQYAVHFISKSIVKKCVEERFEVDKGGEIVFLSKFCSWKKCIYEVEKELKCEGKIKYMIFKDNTNSYRV